MRAHLLIDVPLTAAAITGAVVYGPWALAAAGVVGLSVHAWASFSPRSSLYLRVHWRLPADESGFALTFDDGPHPEHTPRLLDLLAAHGQRATFFVIGEHARAHGALLRRMRAEGHAIGLHSDRHSRWFNCWPLGRVIADLRACTAAIADATGEAPPRLFRPPVGLKNPLVSTAVSRLGLIAVTWSARGWDTQGASAERIAERVRRSAQPRAIIMLHDGHEPQRPGNRHATIAALATVLPQWSLSARHSRALIAADGAVRLA